MSSLHRIALTFLASVAVVTAATAVSAPVGSDGPFRGANYSNHLAGPKLAPDGLRGKVVLLEYFGFN